MKSYDIVGDAVMDFWSDTHPQPVVCFFYQKYDYETEWEWCMEVADCENCFCDYIVVFENDFCEGQTEVKDLAVVPLDDVLEFYAKLHNLQK